MRLVIIRTLAILFVLITLINADCFAIDVIKIDIIIRKPGEINVNKYPRIALGLFTNQDGQETASSKTIADCITQALHNLNTFEVLDRQYMINIANEHNLKFSDMFDLSTVKAFGKYLGTSALICGRMQIDSFLIEQDQYTFTEKNDYLSICTEKYTLAINLTIIDIESGKIITIKNLRSFKQKVVSDLNNIKQTQDRDELFYECVQDIARQFAESIKFKKIKVQIEYEIDDKVPETKKALLSLKLEETYEAINYLYEAISNKDFAKLNKLTQACVYYDLGLIQTYTGDYIEACQNLKTAIQLNPNSKRYVVAYEKAKDEKAYAEQLKMKEM